MWIPITIAAATFQILRTSRQHRLRELLSPIGAGYVRYLYGAPLALLLAGTWFGALDHPVPEVPARFWPIRSEEHTSELQSLMRLSYAVLCLQNKTRSRQA